MPLYHASHDDRSWRRRTKRPYKVKCRKQRPRRNRRTYRYTKPNTSTTQVNGDSTQLEGSRLRKYLFNQLPLDSSYADTQSLIRSQFNKTSSIYRMQPEVHLTKKRDCNNDAARLMDMVNQQNVVVPEVGENVNIWTDLVYSRNFGIYSAFGFRIYS